MWQGKCIFSHFNIILADLKKIQFTMFKSAWLTSPKNVTFQPDKRRVYTCGVQPANYWHRLVSTRLKLRFKVSNVFKTAFRSQTQHNATQTRNKKDLSVKGDINKANTMTSFICPISSNHRFRHCAPSCLLQICRHQTQLWVWSCSYKWLSVQQ